MTEQPINHETDLVAWVPFTCRERRVAHLVDLGEHAVSLRAALHPALPPAGRCGRRCGTGPAA